MGLWVVLAPIAVGLAACWRFVYVTDLFHLENVAIKVFNNVINTAISHIPQRPVSVVVNTEQ